MLKKGNIVMDALNQYNLYSMMGTEMISAEKDINAQELSRVRNAFMNFHKPETYKERKKFVNDTLQGRNYNQTIEYNDETMDFEFTEAYVRVTLHSSIESRNNKYFQYSNSSSE